MNAASDKSGRGEYAAALAMFLRHHHIGWRKAHEAERQSAAMTLHQPLACDLLLESADGTLWLTQVRGRRSEQGTECWAEAERLEALSRAESDWGSGHRGLLLFIHRHQQEPLKAPDRWHHADRWYAFWGIELGDYLTGMKQRSERWGTVSLASADFMHHRRPIRRQLGLAESQP